MLLWVVYSNSAAQVVTVDSVHTLLPPAAAMPDSTNYYGDEEENEYSFEPVNNISDSIQLRKVQNNYFNKVKESKIFDYVKNGIPKEKVVVKNIESKQYKLSNFIPYLAVLLFLGFLTWYLISNNIISFKRKSTFTTENSEEVLEQEDIFSIQYKQAIQMAVQNKNYRLAVRLQYLQLLKQLADKKIINYQPEKTNFEYLLQLKPTTYHDDFFTVTRNYEYSWYGLFDLNEQQYHKIEEQFMNINKKLA